MVSFLSVIQVLRRHKCFWKWYSTCLCLNWSSRVCLQEKETRQLVTDLPCFKLARQITPNNFTTLLFLSCFHYLTRQRNPHFVLTFIFHLDIDQSERKLPAVHTSFSRVSCFTGYWSCSILLWSPHGFDPIFSVPGFLLFQGYSLLTVGNFSFQVFLCTNIQTSLNMKRNKAQKLFAWDWSLSDV